MKRKKMQKYTKNNNDYTGISSCLTIYHCIPNSFFLSFDLQCYYSCYYRCKLLRRFCFGYVFGLIYSTYKFNSQLDPLPSFFNSFSFTKSICLCLSKFENWYKGSCILFRLIWLVLSILQRLFLVATYSEDIHGIVISPKKICWVHANIKKLKH